MASPIRTSDITYSDEARHTLGKPPNFSAIEMMNEAVAESFRGNPITAERIEKAAAALRHQWMGEQNGS